MGEGCCGTRVVVLFKGPVGWSGEGRGRGGEGEGQHRGAACLSFTGVFQGQTGPGLCASIQPEGAVSYSQDWPQVWVGDPHTIYPSWGCHFGSPWPQCPHLSSGCCPASRGVTCVAQGPVGEAGVAESPTSQCQGGFREEAAGARR